MFTILFSALGVLGLGGVVAVAVFAPAVATVVGQAVIAFAKTRLGVAVVVAGIAIPASLIFAEQRTDAAWQEKWDAKIAEAKAEKEEFERQAEAKNKLAAAMLQDRLTKTETELKEKADALAAAAGNTCLLGDDFARRLRELVGQTAAPKPADKNSRPLQRPRKKGAAAAVGWEVGQPRP